MAKLPLSSPVHGRRSCWQTERMNTFATKMRDENALGLALHESEACKCQERPEHQTGAVTMDGKTT